MDNLTHSLVGLAAAKAGLERTSPYSTAVCVIAANLPDADLVMLLDGSWTYLKHHRGLSHSIVGTLTLAVLLPLIFYGIDRSIARLRRRPPRARLGGLLLSSLILSASHPLMDWTNNYGLRPLLPWSGQWFYGDLVFIVDPWLWVSLGGAVFLLTAKSKWRIFVWAAFAMIVTTMIFLLPPRWGVSYPLASYGLWLVAIAGLAVAHRAQLAARWGGAIAAVSLALVVVYWGALAALHRRALAQAQDAASQMAVQRQEVLMRVAAMPTLANPLRWHCIAETNRAWTRFDLQVNYKVDETGATMRDALRFEKPEGATAEIVERVAAQDERAKIFLDFARFPATRVARNCMEEMMVQFADLRFTEPGNNRRGGTFALDVPIKTEPQ